MALSSVPQVPLILERGRGEGRWWASEIYVVVWKEIGGLHCAGGDDNNGEWG